MRTTTIFAQTHTSERTMSPTGLFFIAFDFNSLKIQLRLIGVTFRAAMTQVFSYPNRGVQQRKLSDGGDKTRVIMH